MCSQGCYTNSIMINWFIHSFSDPLPPNPVVYTIRLLRWSRFHLCHFSGVYPHGSSPQNPPAPPFKKKSDGASPWMVCYQQGLPRLVWTFIDLTHEGLEFSSKCCLLKHEKIWFTFFVKVLNSLTNFVNIPTANPEFKVSSQNLIVFKSPQK